MDALLCIMKIIMKKLMIFALGVVGTIFVMAVPSAHAAASIVWQKEFPNSPFTFASPNLVRANGGAMDIIAGSSAPYSGGGYTPSTSRIYDGDTGNILQTFDVGANSFSVADVDKDGNDDIFIGAGGSQIECQGNGGLYSYSVWGALRFTPKHFDDAAGYTGAQCSNPSIFSSPALGDVNKDGTADASFGALGLKAWSADANGKTNYGWPYYWDDTQYGSPALADLTGDGQAEVIMPGDSSPGGQVDHRGGMVRAFTGKGQQLWEFRTNEIVRSSPSIGDITGGGDISIVFGTGNYWARQPGGASDCSKVFALRRDGSLIWSTDIGAQTMASPTLADFNGDGRLDVAIGGWQRPCTPPASSMVNDGRVWILDGKTGQPMNGYPRASGGSLIIGQIVSADWNNDGAQDAVVPTANGIHVFDGKNGTELATLAYGGDGVSFQNAPIVTDLDGNGRMDIIVAGTKGDGSTGVIRRYEMAAGDTATLGANGWPMNRKDQRQTGSWTPTKLFDPPTGEIGKGYWQVAADGGVFPFGEALGYGSTGNIQLTKPMVGLESTPSGAGYWLVAADGGIFPFGDAVGRGSTGNIRLTQPVVGMQRTPSGNGYWLVAADGGVFPFGDARGYGSTGNIRLTKPVVGMASTPSGNGYWLVAADGGIFPFGDARGYGSTGNIALRQPIVGMQASASGNGYWLVAADGGIFPFGDAGRGYGSAGNLALVKPIVGMVRSPAGGYTMAASDGGTFSYNAQNYGSLGSLPLFKPMVGIASVGGD
jgi:hypothetical protein